MALTTCHLRLPVQAALVDRTPVGSAPAAGAGGQLIPAAQKHDPPTMKQWCAAAGPQWPGCGPNYEFTADGGSVCY
jgi:hypothetical protein